MSLWIAVHLPRLPLEAFRPHWLECGPFVVIDREGAVAASTAARAAGVRLGMKRAGVQALCPEVQFQERDEGHERQTLEHIGLSLLRFTPEVAPISAQDLVLDVSASLRVFGGVRALCRALRQTVRTLGFSLRLGVAPTATGAFLLASSARTAGARRQRRTTRMSTLVRYLDALPCMTLPEARPFDDWLEGIGCRTLGALRRLPRAGLKRRCSPALLQELDRAYGEAREMFVWIEAPLEFNARLDLPERVEQAEAMLFALRRLLLQMIGWLSARQLAVQRFVVTMEHERGRRAIAPTLLEIVLAEPAWQEAHLVRLLKERLGRLVLAAPVIGVRLEATQIAAMAPPNASLFPEPSGSASDWNQLVELLTARLGEEGVLLPVPEQDHRPEKCNRWVPAASAPRSLSPLPARTRPFWLLEQPLPLAVKNHRPFHRTPLQLVSPAERIEGGWWDGRLVMRDYFIARDAASVRYWVYRERVGDDIHWYLHGLFA